MYEIQAKRRHISSWSTWNTTRPNTNWRQFNKSYLKAVTMLWKMQLWEEEVSVDSGKITNRLIEMETTPTKTAKTNPIVGKTTWWSRYQSIVSPLIVVCGCRNEDTYGGSWQCQPEPNAHDFIVTHSNVCHWFDLSSCCVVIFRLSSDGLWNENFSTWAKTPSSRHAAPTPSAVSSKAMRMSPVRMHTYLHERGNN